MTTPVPTALGTSAAAASAAAAATAGYTDVYVSLVSVIEECPRVSCTRVRELALSPDSRGRTGITDADPNGEDVDNPFAG